MVPSARLKFAHLYSTDWHNIVSQVVINIHACSIDKHARHKARDAAASGKEQKGLHAPPAWQDAHETNWAHHPVGKVSLLSDMLSYAWTRRISEAGKCAQADHTNARQSLVLCCTMQNEPPCLRHNLPARPCLSVHAASSAARLLPLACKCAM